MGLILFGAILVLFYVAKIFFPEFIVGVAEIPSIVEFWNFVDSHLWAFLIFHATISFIGGYIYCCACCRQNKLSKKQTLIFVAFTILYIILQQFAVKISQPYNYVMLVLAPLLMCLVSENISKETFISTVVCFSFDITMQALSLVIRDVVVLSSCLNSATMTILLIDAYICKVLLYLFFNFKKGE